MAYRRDDPHRYDDVINMPHHVSVTHPHMTLYDRAAQFAPFKALSGYEDDVDETARLTDERIELDESRKDFLDARLQLLEEHFSDAPVVTATYFRPDERKSGGAYFTVTGSVKKIDAIERALVLRDGSRIAIDDIYGIESELFGLLEE